MPGVVSPSPRAQTTFSRSVPVLKQSALPTQNRLDSIPSAGMRDPLNHLSAGLESGVVLEAKPIESFTKSTGNPSIPEGCSTLATRLDLLLTPDALPSIPHHALVNRGFILAGRLQDPGHLENITEAAELSCRGMGKGTCCIEADFENHLVLRRHCASDACDIANAILIQGQAVTVLSNDHGDINTDLKTFAGWVNFRFAGEVSGSMEAIAARRSAINLSLDGHKHLGFILKPLFGRKSIPAGICKTVVVMDHTTWGPYNDCLSITSATLGHDDEAFAGLRTLIYSAPKRQSGPLLQFYGLSVSSRMGAKERHTLSRNPERTFLERWAVKIIPAHSAGLEQLLIYVGERPIESYKEAGNKDGADEAIQVNLSQRIIGPPTTPAYYPWSAPRILSHLNTGGQAEHPNGAISCFRGASEISCSELHTRWEASKRWALYLDRFLPDSEHVLGEFGRAIQVLALRGGLDQTDRRRYDALEEHPGLPLKAAATAFRFEQPEKALEWLEQGRCLVWRQQNHIRKRLDELRLRDPSLFERVARIVTKDGDAGSSSNTPNISMVIPTGASNKDEELVEQARFPGEWDRVIASIRSTSGFEDFLQPPSFSAIAQNLPDEGPVVVINIDDCRCDAVALLAGLDEPLHIPLPGFSFKMVQTYRSTLNGLLHSQGLRVRKGMADLDDNKQGFKDEGDTNEVSSLDSKMGDEVRERALGVYRREEVGLRHILRDLWSYLVKPILDALAITKADVSRGDTLPRIWWCPTGPLTFLPIHAAGEYEGPRSESLMDYAVSSYTTTVSALTHRVTHDQPITPTVSGLFLTSQPDVPGASRIPGTAREVELVHAHAQEQGLRVSMAEGDAVSPEECLERMEEYSCIHLACHGSQDISDPLQSRFLFHKGRLSLHQISQRNLQQADLAFLSACETGTGKESLSDEAIHLAGGMLAAGYRRVVATMWSIGDAHAPQVADDFYRYLSSQRAKEGMNGFDGSRSAHALHHAIQLLRKRLGGSKSSQASDSALLAWVPYVHYGY